MTLLGVQRENGCAPSCSSILYSPSYFPNPLKSEGNSLMGNTSSWESTDAILLMSPRPAIVGCPSNDLASPFATKISVRI